MTTNSTLSHPKYQQFLETIHFNGTTYGIRALILGNLIGENPLTTLEITQYLEENYFDEELQKPVLDQVQAMINDLWPEVEQAVNKKQIVLLSPIKITSETEEILEALVTRQEEVMNLLAGLALSEALDPDAEEHEDLMDNLEQFIDECDDLFTDIEDAEDIEDYRHDMLAMIEESEDVWNDAFDFLFA